ncbi:acyl-homoserine-lactone synthase [Kushneria konosiri]|uniref:Acyl-homoserine-lactone synthase n=1 Tax=Kushneria konosiri TaxID=698828 RepID=A0A2Z2H5H5_9GAMM|nr:PEP-CTERM/exosortase system-associated acyltransferase [Kushneria konosiri]ARS52623.1 hypothetical protein B9G99_06820 [Kushneria konosiri]
MEFVSAFFERFDVRLASSEADKHEIYRLRHEVFLQELGYELSGVPENGEERDDYDSNAIYIVVIGRFTQQIVGSARIVVPQTHVAGRLSYLPVENYCGKTLFSSTVQLESIPRDELCEISRIVVARHYRKRKDLEGNDLKTAGLDAVNRLISIALFVSSAALLETLGRPHVMGFIEKKFARLLRGTGMKIERISPFHDICGLRAAYYGNTRDSLRHVSPLFSHMYTLVKERLDKSDASSALANHGSD